jgi:hypothetical protein
MIGKELLEAVMVREGISGREANDGASPLIKERCPRKSAS